MVEFYDVVDETRAIVVGTPIYFDHVSAQLKAFMDRPLFTEARFGRIAELVDFPDYRAVHCPNCERLCRERVSIGQTCLLGTIDDMRDIVRAVEKVKENVDELLGSD